jgi:hypothetical protein
VDDDGFERVRPPQHALVQAVMSILVEAGIDPTAPVDPGVLSFLGIKVRRSRYLLPHQMLVVGEFDRPSDWYSLPPDEQIAEALKRGAILFIHDPEE